MEWIASNVGRCSLRLETWDVERQKVGVTGYSKILSVALNDRVICIQITICRVPSSFFKCIGVVAATRRYVRTSRGSQKNLRQIRHPWLVSHSPFTLRRQKLFECHLKFSKRASRPIAKRRNAPTKNENKTRRLQWGRRRNAGDATSSSRHRFATISTTVFTTASYPPRINGRQILCFAICAEHDSRLLPLSIHNHSRHIRRGLVRLLITQILKLETVVLTHSVN